MRTTIYIPDELVGEIREAAWKERRSVSIYGIYTMPKKLHRKLEGQKE